MKLYAPNYAKDFHCIASACRHSCCVGWEIDIDEASLAKYESLSGDFGKRLCQEIVKEDGTAFFRLAKGDRCPFLNEKGLCEMILTLGEDSLCNICRDHPRFRNFFSDREEIGIGLCCEEAANVILSQEEDTEILLLSGDGEDGMLWEEEEALITLRDRLFSILQDKTKPLTERIEKMLSTVGAVPIKEEELPLWAETLSSLERMDEAWDPLLASLTAPLCHNDISYLDNAFEKLILYFLYRHLPDAEDENDIRARVRFAHLGYTIIRAICQNTDTPIYEAARLYSAEIEYSEENTEILLQKLAEI